MQSPRAPSTVSRDDNADAHSRPGRKLPHLPRSDKKSIPPSVRFKKVVKKINIVRGFARHVAPDGGSGSVANFQSRRYASSDAGTRTGLKELEELEREMNEAVEDEKNASAILADSSGAEPTISSRRSSVASLSGTRRAGAGSDYDLQLEREADTDSQLRSILGQDISLRELQDLKKIFDEVDADGGGTVDEAEFSRAFNLIVSARSKRLKNTDAKVMKPRGMQTGNQVEDEDRLLEMDTLTDDQLKRLFMRIDANANGTIDWDEFSSYVLLGSQAAGQMEEEVSPSVEFREDKPHFKKIYYNTEHTDMISSMCYLSKTKQYATASRDGSVRIWSQDDLSHVVTLKTGSNWVTGMAYFPYDERLAVSCLDRSILLYDIRNNGENFDLVREFRGKRVRESDLNAMAKRIHGQLERKFGSVTNLEVGSAKPAGNRLSSTMDKRNKYKLLNQGTQNQLLSPSSSRRKMTTKIPLSPTNAPAAPVSPTSARNVASRALDNIGTQIGFGIAGGGLGMNKRGVPVVALQENMHCPMTMSRLEMVPGQVVLPSNLSLARSNSGSTIMSSRAASVTMTSYTGYTGRSGKSRYSGLTGFTAPSAAAVSVSQTIDSAISASAAQAKAAKDKKVILGTDVGEVEIFDLSQGEKETVAKDVISGISRLFYMKPHTEWVTQASYIEDLDSLVTASLDSDIHILNLEKQRKMRTLSGHRKGVFAFSYSPEYKVLASAGSERSVFIWNPYISNPLAKLEGHRSSLVSLLFNDAHKQLISISQDKMVKIWDMRTFKCCQSFQEFDVHRPEDTLTALMYDDDCDSFLVGGSRIKRWTAQKHVTVEGRAAYRTHQNDVVGTLVNSTFGQIITADPHCVYVWALADGRLVYKFAPDLPTVALLETGGSVTSTKRSAVSAIALDSTGRRLITAGAGGVIRVWNYINGQCLKEYHAKSTSGASVKAKTIINDILEEESTSTRFMTAKKSNAAAPDQSEQDAELLRTRRRRRATDLQKGLGVSPSQQGKTPNSARNFPTSLTDTDRTFSSELYVQATATVSDQLHLSSVAHVTQGSNSFILAAGWTPFIYAFADYEGAPSGPIRVILRAFPRADCLSMLYVTPTVVISGNDDGVIETLSFNSGEPLNAHAVSSDGRAKKLLPVSVDDHTAKQNKLRLSKIIDGDDVTPGDISARSATTQRRVDQLITALREGQAGQIGEQSDIDPTVLFGIQRGSNETEDGSVAEDWRSERSYDSDSSQESLSRVNLSGPASVECMTDLGEDNDMYATGTANGMVHFWSKKTGQRIYIFLASIEGNPILSMAADTVREELYVGDLDGYVRILDYQTLRHPPTRPPENSLQSVLKTAPPETASPRRVRIAGALEVFEEVQSDTASVSHTEASESAPQGQDDCPLSPASAVTRSEYTVGDRDTSADEFSYVALDYLFRASLASVISLQVCSERQVLVIGCSDQTVHVWCMKRRVNIGQLGFGSEWKVEDPMTFHRLTMGSQEEEEERRERELAYCIKDINDRKERWKGWRKDARREERERLRSQLETIRNERLRAGKSVSDLEASLDTLRVASDVSEDGSSDSGTETAKPTEEIEEYFANIHENLRRQGSTLATPAERTLSYGSLTPRADPNRSVAFSPTTPVNSNTEEHRRALSLSLDTGLAQAHNAHAQRESMDDRFMQSLQPNISMHLPLFSFRESAMDMVKSAREAREASLSQYSERVSARLQLHDVDEIGVISTFAGNVLDDTELPRPNKKK